MQKIRNVVVILADQLRLDCLGCYGNRFVHTPNLDRLAAGGVRFSRSYVANPICMPNRVSLFTGRYPANHGVWTNGLCCAPMEQTLPSVLRQNGYQTANIGKIHFSPYSPESAPVSPESEARWPEVPDSPASLGGYGGFDYIEFTLGHTLPRSHYYKWFLEHGGSNDLFAVEPFPTDYPHDQPCGVRRMPSRLSSSQFVGERAANYLAHVRDSRKPFFLCVSFPDPHHPFTSCFDDFARYCEALYALPAGSPEDLSSRPAHYEEHYRGAWSRAGRVEPAHPQGVPPEVEAQRIRHTYAMIEAIDRNVGTLLNSLEEQGLSQSTAVFFLSDHGELLGDHGLWLKGPFFYEGLVNTPLLLRAPGVEPSASAAMISSVDIAPTVYELLGLPIPDFCDGISFLPRLSGGSGRDACLIQYRNGYGERDCASAALVTKDAKYVRYETGEEELTDLAADPRERQNILGQPGSDPLAHEMQNRLLCELLKAKSRGDTQYGLA